ncbi:MAG: MarR family winged helix-turn-helix transcriptional regulator [Holosporales bacterium]|jgi:DNA-binding MarR family transcriptional regulator|nr:MarR family winged helix-turn-helix transcriptional regulator [Holosporales bacterium]
MRNSCVEISVCGEKNYRLFLDIIKQELDSIGAVDINAIQAFILMNINDNVVTIGEVITRGYYIGSNASYNIKKMTMNNYIHQTQSDFDKRAAYLKLTQKGLNLCNKLYDSVNNYLKIFETSIGGDFDIDQCIGVMKKIEHFWKDILMRRV